jgi:hypothetical protein
MSAFESEATDFRFCLVKSSRAVRCLNLTPRVSQFGCHSHRSNWIG